MAFLRARDTGNERGEPPVLWKIRSSKAFIILAVVFAIFTDIFLYALIVPVVPTALHERVGIAEADEQRWMSILLGIYGATFLAGSPLSGYLADRIESRRGPLIAGLIALGGSTAMLCVGTHIGLWIAGRLLQGASAAVVYTVGMALLIDTVNKDGLAQAMGYVDMASTIGVCAGPLLGGVIYERSGYYAVYAFAFALIGVDIFLRLAMIERKHAVRWLSSNEEAAEESPSTEEKTNLPEAAATSAASQPAEETTQETPSQNVRHPLLNLVLSPRMLVAIWVYFTASIVLTSFDSTLPLFVQELFHWRQTAQGLIFLPLCIPHLFDPLIGYFVDRYGHIRRYLAASALLCSVPLMVVLRFVSENTMKDKITLCAILALLGVCLAFLSPPVMVEVFYIIQAKEAENPRIFGKGGAIAFGYGMMNAAYAAGSIVGPFFGGFIKDHAGWGTMAWAMALLMGVSVVPTLLYLGGFIRSR